MTFMFEFHSNFYKDTPKALSIFPRTSLNYLRVKSLSLEVLILLSILTSPTRLWFKHSNNTWIHFIKSWIFATLVIDLHDVILRCKHEQSEKMPTDPTGMYECT